MCGIAGYSLSATSMVERRLASQALLAAIAERGADAVGYAYRSDDGDVVVHKQRSGASALLDRLAVEESTRQVLLHVRDYTKGHPTIDANNHPIRHGSVVGIHNGIIFNDEQILAEHGFRRADPRMSVDSEAIFALANHFHARPEALEQLRGSMAAAWFDDRRPDVLFCARGTGRPLWLGEGRDGTFFASTKLALEVVERYARIRLRKFELDEGTLVQLEDGRVHSLERFTPDRSFEESPLPAVRAPREGAFCLQRLAKLAAAA